MTEAIKNKDTGGIIAFASDMLGYRKQPIPGRNATYGEEIDRVKQETRDEIAASLTAQQREAFEDTNIDPMLGGGGTMAYSVFQAKSKDGEEEEGAVIGESIEITIDDGDEEDD
jgi:hypothetical protein